VFVHILGTTCEHNPKLKRNAAINKIMLSVFATSTFTNTSAILDNKSNGRAITTTTNMTFPGNMMPRKNMTMPGGMTFGASLQNAKMHLTEAIIDLKTGNTKEAAMELNLTAQNIKIHDQELKIMMMQVKNMMTNMKIGPHNTTNSSA
jgi:hypothetical protein